MKIVYFTHQYFPRHVGGTEVYTRGLVRQAVRQGHEVTVVTCHESPCKTVDEFHVEETNFEGVKVIELHLNLSLMDNIARAEYENPYVATVLPSILAELHPDLVHVMHAMKLSSAALSVCDRMKIPFIVTLCDFWFICPTYTLLNWRQENCSGPDRPLKCVSCVSGLHDLPTNLQTVMAVGARKDTLRKLLLKARKIFALSDFQRATFARNGYPADRIETCTHGLEISDLESAINPAQRKDGPLVIGFVGSLIEHKGAHILIEALLTLPSANVELRIIGPLQKNEYGQRLRQLAAKDRRCKLEGAVETERLGQVIRQFDVLAVPALWYENSPLVVKAAKYLHVHVMLSDIGSLPEMIGPESGTLVKPGCVKSWAQAMETAAQHGRQFYLDKATQENFGHVKTMDENAVEVFRAYEEVVGTCARQCART